MYSWSRKIKLMHWNRFICRHIEREGDNIVRYFFKPIAALVYRGLVCVTLVLIIRLFIYYFIIYEHSIIVFSCLFLFYFIIILFQYLTCTHKIYMYNVYISLYAILFSQATYLLVKVYVIQYRHYIFSFKLLL